MNNKILVLAGPTAVGKTALSIELAKRLNQKIIFDGRNIYSPKIRKAGFELYQIGCWNNFENFY